MILSIELLEAILIKREKIEFALKLKVCESIKTICGDIRTDSVDSSLISRLQESETQMLRQIVRLTQIQSPDFADRTDRKRGKSQNPEG